MANYATLKASVNNVITTNGNNEITGALLNQLLNSIIESLGAQFQLVGVAKSSTTPGTPDQNVAYLAGPGTYPNFGPTVVPVGNLAIMKYNGTWTYELFPVNMEMAKKVTINPGKNLFNINTAIQGKFVNTSGGLTTGSSYSASDFIPVVGGQTYHASQQNNGSIGSASAVHCWYDENFTFISYVAGPVRDLTAPANAAYLRISYVTTNQQIQVEEGTERTGYAPYNPILGYLSDVFARLADLDTKTANFYAKRKLLAVARTTNNYALTGQGASVYKNTHRVRTFAVTAGDVVYIKVSKDGEYTFQWQTDNTVHTGTSWSGVIGAPYTDAADGYFIVPTGATFLAVSELKTNTTNEVRSVFAWSADMWEDVNKKVDIKAGRNLFNVDTINAGYFVSATTGNLNANASYNTSDYIAVEPETNYHVSRANDGIVGTATTGICFYDNTYTFISGVAGDNRNVTTPAGAAFCRFSYAANYTQIQFEKGTARTAYQQYSPIAGYPFSIPEGVIDYDNLTTNLQNIIQGNSSQRHFSGSKNSGTLIAGDVLRVPLACRISKNIITSAKIIGQFTKIAVGNGYWASGYEPNAHWVEIDATTINAYYGPTATLFGTFEHGLSLSGILTVEIDTTATNATIRLFDASGNIFTQALSHWGPGIAFIQNVSSANAISVELSFMPRDITKKIWTFGDSYISFADPARWPKYLNDYGFTNWLSDNRPGLAPATALNDLQALLNISSPPEIIVWTLGMNGAASEEQSGGTYVINSEQKSVIDSVVALCASYEIMLVLTTIPTVPTIQRTGYNNYIKSLGLRYIDFAEAVGATESGYWYSGLLSSDNVHPTVAGAKVLASRALLDCPELTLAY